MMLLKCICNVTQYIKYSTNLLMFYISFPCHNIHRCSGIKCRTGRTEHSGQTILNKQEKSISPNLNIEVNMSRTIGHHGESVASLVQKL